MLSGGWAFGFRLFCEGFLGNFKKVIRGGTDVVRTVFELCLRPRQVFNLFIIACCGCSFDYYSLLNGLNN